MKTIGLMAGMSWESSIEYYRIMNERVHELLGGNHSAQILMYSVEFDEYVKLMDSGRWDTLRENLTGIAKMLEQGGADLIVLCTNTMHKMADDIQKEIDIPLLHIVDAAAEKIKAGGMKKVGLLGTKFTMEHDFYRNRLKEKHSIDVVIPAEDERQTVHDVIISELTNGMIKDSSRQKYLDIIKNLADAGAEAVVLGCTEIPLLVKQEHCSVPLIDTTTIHALAAVDLALK